MNGWTSFPDIIDAVAEVARVSKPGILGESRCRELAYPRHLIILLARQRCGWMTPEQLGYYLNRERTTINYAFAAAKERLEDSEQFRILYERVVARLDSHAEAAE